MHQFFNVNAGYLEINELENNVHHAHEEYVITLMLSGYVTLQGEATILIKPGTLTLVPSGYPHTLLKGNNMTVHWLSFNLANEQLIGNESIMQLFHQIRRGSLPIFQLNKQRMPFVICLFKEIEQELSRASSDVVLTSLINLIINEASKASKVMSADLGSETKVNKAMQYIEHHCCDNISLKDVAKIVHVSPAHLTTKVKEHTGYTVGQWILKYKLKIALNLLKNTDQTIEQITERVGWNDATYFIRQFKKAYQITPAAWRRQYSTLTIKHSL